MTPATDHSWPSAARANAAKVLFLLFQQVLLGVVACHAPMEVWKEAKTPEKLWG